MFVGLALTGIVPIIHALSIHGWQGVKQLGLQHYLFEFLCYIIAVVFYIVSCVKC